MKKSTIVNYVCHNAFLLELSTHNNYSVRFPLPDSEMIFVANDLETLIERVWNFVNTNAGTNLVNHYDFTEYLEENYNPEGDEK